MARRHPLGMHGTDIADMATSCISFRPYQWFKILNDAIGRLEVS